MCGKYSLPLYKLNNENMETLVCTLCIEEKPVNEFYKNNLMPSGYANQCKVCVKARAKIREETLRQDPEWVEIEKVRAREKYKRLNYKEKQKKWDEKRPWTTTSIYKNLNRNLKLDKTQTAHHWNYNFLEDVLILDRKIHRKLHKFLKFDEETWCFRTIENNILDSKEKHEEYLNKIKNL